MFTICFLYIRTNKYGLPIITSLFSRAGETLKADYYGYINSDILIEPSIFSVLDFCKEQVSKGILSEQVGIWEQDVINSMKLVVVYMRETSSIFLHPFLQWLLILCSSVTILVTHEPFVQEGVQ